jgi:Icc protein
MLHFVHITDTHIGPDKDFILYDVSTLRSVETLVEKINRLPVRPDFVLHTGDIAADASPQAYRLAAEAFAPLEMPVYYVTGNHDASPLIREYLPMGPKEDLLDGALCYRVDIAGQRLLVLDARGPDEIETHGQLSAEQMDLLADEVRGGRGPLSVAIHFPPFELDSPWLDEAMLLLNGERLHRILKPAAPRLRGVFFGHVHRGMQVYRDGILYSSVGSTFCQFAAWPGRERPVKESPSPCFFNLVSLSAQRTVIKEHFILPEND